MEEADRIVENYVCRSATGHQRLRRINAIRPFAHLDRGGIRLTKRKRSSISYRIRGVLSTI